MALDKPAVEYPLYNLYYFNCANVHVTTMPPVNSSIGMWLIELDQCHSLCVCTDGWGHEDTMEHFR